MVDVSEMFEAPLLQYDLTDPEAEPKEIISAEKKKEIQMMNWSINPDQTLILFETALNVSSETIYRHSFLANYAIYSIEDGYYYYYYYYNYYYYYYYYYYFNYYYYYYF